MEILAIARSFVDLFFPVRCIYCHKIIENKTYLCVKCGLQLPLTHWAMDDQNSAYQKLRNLCELESACSLLYFERKNVTQQLLHHLKYKRQKKIGYYIAELTKLDLNEIDGLISIPIHPKNLKKRGYNQVSPFTERISELYQIPVLNDFLTRTKFNQSQVQKSRIERLSSIGNSFEINDKKLNGHYLLIDDLVTTGATLSTCVNLIKSQNDVKISVLTMGFAL